MCAHGVVPHCACIFLAGVIPIRLFGALVMPTGVATVFSSTYAPHTAHLKRKPFTKQQVFDAAAHWRALAEKEDAAADWQVARGLPYGDISPHRARARLYRQVSEELEAQAQEMIQSQEGERS